MHIVDEFEMLGRIAAMRVQSREFDVLAAIRPMQEASGVELAEESDVTSMRL